MYCKKTFYLKLLEKIDQYSFEEVVSFFFTDFDIDKGYGFLGTEVIESKTISSNLIYRSIISQNIFNPETKKLEKQEQEQFYQVPFRLYIESGVLQGYTSTTKFSRLLSTLSSIFRKNLIIKDVFIDPQILFSEIEKHKLRYGSIGLTINNFRLSKELSGRFTTSTDNIRLAKTLVNEYSKDISEILIEHFIDIETVIWHFFGANKFLIKAEESIIDEQESLVLEVVLRCQNG